MVGAGGAPRVPVAPSNATGDGPPPALTDRFDKWYRGGVEVLAYNPDAARAYFAVETRKALDAIDEAASGVALRSVARVLKLFAEGLSGHPVTIRPLAGSRGDTSTIARRSLTHGMSVRELVVELLLQMSAGDPD